MGGTISCRELTGLDLTNPEEIEELMKSEVPQNVCYPAVATAHRLVVDLLRENEWKTAGTDPRRSAPASSFLSWSCFTQHPDCLPLPQRESEVIRPDHKAENGFPPDQLCETEREQPTGKPDAAGKPPAENATLVLCAHLPSFHNPRKSTAECVSLSDEDAGLRVQ